ncbi:phosphoribosylglycinamide formyltransferase [Saccharomycopsis crataegensis]|uniref:Phosphoribosylglycinamide formyltransferase n=1 Tax=Saccharomycopsis crataegensis TaxID=43959 RepID=A0AAV5QNL9_9ASCO|nr:phosphoribosylglycinamide formyltransferase [Saccharomycopsis crataegensis]
MATSEALANITVLISGNGSNLQALIDAIAEGTIKAKISLVISSSPTAYGLERAAKANIPTKIHTLKSYYSSIPADVSPEEKKKQRAKAREVFNQDLLNIILFGDKYASQESVAATPFSSGHKSPGLIVCAGWMLILSKDFLVNLHPYNIPIINLHPALPGQFEGINAIERSWKAAQDGEVDKTGIMIHKVIPEVDKGEPLLVKELSVIKGETLEEYEARVHAAEHDGIVEGTVLALKTLI